VHTASRMVTRTLSIFSNELSGSCGSDGKQAALVVIWALDVGRCAPGMRNLRVTSASDKKTC
jgi:hypothetical protein